VVWVGIDRGADTLQALALRLDDALSPLGFVRETRPFRAHLTIGRVKSPRGIAKVTKLLAASPAEFGETRITSVELQQSRLQRTGAEYSLVEQFILLTNT
jgi:2'-5' RNA ligase